MAKTKEEKNIEVKAQEEKNIQETPKEVKNDNKLSYEDLLKMVTSLAQEVDSLKQNKNIATSSDKTDKILELLSQRKSDKEVVIVHNRELLGGLCTAIKLNGVNIEFRTLGEQRVLSWQQFEECVSKYRSFFDQEIILVSDEYADIAERYSIPCVKRGKHTFTRNELLRLNKMEPRELADFFNSLTESDQEFVCSYWLGKCYEKADGFYDRYKIEMLNALSKARVFDNLLASMNGDFRNTDNK